LEARVAATAATLAVQQVLDRCTAEIIEQQPHRHPARGRRGQFIEQQPAGDIVAPDIILDVDASLRAPHQREAHRQRQRAIIQQLHAVLAGVRIAQSGQRRRHAASRTQIGR
jgi:hypothetical protein